MLVERGLLRSAADALRPIIPSHSKTFLLSSDAILKLWGSRLVETLRPSGCAVELVEMPDGESAKRFASVEKSTQLSEERPVSI